jgi:lipoprotein-releasing system permease protein
VGVIAIVVWLLLVFLSVTEGMENGWLTRLTTLHAPIRITPTSLYYDSYYYQIDAFASNSGYRHKSLAQKQGSINPYNSEEDGALPYYFPPSEEKDLVGELVAILEKEGLLYQDFEMSTALLKLQILNPKTKEVRYVTQATYLSTPPSINPSFNTLLLAPNTQDLKHWIELSPYSTELSRQDNASLSKKTSKEKELERILYALQNVDIQIPQDPAALESLICDLKEDRLKPLRFKENGPTWLSRNSQGQIQLPVNTDKEIGVLLAKSFADGGVQVGDRGYLSYSTQGSGALQEQRLPVFVSGFYDPGVFAMGNKCVLVPHTVTQTINASNISSLLDKTQSNGFLIFIPAIDKAPEVAKQIEQKLKEKGIDAYWKVTPFTSYDFAKDLLGQFQSDRLLFMLVGLIILIVGCCNVVSMGVLLVNDKKKEIGILQAMGASKGMILRVFAYCGAIVGGVSCILGTTFALLTLANINTITSWLSLIQGREAFNPLFFGSTLPSTLSPSATLFILIVTPLLSLAAGLIPAIKACRLQPSNLLKSE